MEKLIRKVETEWLNILYEYNHSAFSSKWLPSHDQTHHHRVWIYVKEILYELYLQGYEFSEHRLGQMMIAVFFHDIGLSVTVGENHGRMSRVLCERFLRERYPGMMASNTEMLEAIEHHDDKMHVRKQSVNPGKSSIYSILTAGDDMDAFGAIGVFRYLEIYLLRGISHAELPDRVISNLDTRFHHFDEKFGGLERLKKNQEEKARYTRDFFIRLKKEQADEHYAKTEHGAIPVMNIIERRILKDKKDPGLVAREAGKYSDSKFSKSFFTRFLNELVSGNTMSEYYFT